VLRELWAHRQGKPVSLKVLTEVSGLPANRVTVLVAQLAGAGILERSPRGLKQLRDFEKNEERAAGHFDATSPTAIATPPPAS
jgi:ATP-dependent DNA helicase RecQ